MSGVPELLLMSGLTPLSWDMAEEHFEPPPAAAAVAAVAAAVPHSCGFEAAVAAFVVAAADVAVAFLLPFCFVSLTHFK